MEPGAWKGVGAYPGLVIGRCSRQVVDHQESWVGNNWGVLPFLLVPTVTSGVHLGSAVGGQGGWLPEIPATLTQDCRWHHSGKGMLVRVSVRSTPWTTGAVGAGGAEGR